MASPRAPPALAPSSDATQEERPTELVHADLVHADLADAGLGKVGELTMSLPAAMTSHPEEPPSSSEGTSESYDAEKRTRGADRGCCDLVMRRLRCLFELCGESGQRRPLLSERSLQAVHDPEAWADKEAPHSRSGLLRRRAEGGVGVTSSTHEPRGAEMREIELERVAEGVGTTPSKYEKAAASRAFASLA